MSDPRLLQIESLLGAALTNLSIAAQMMAEIRKEPGQQPQRAGQDEGPKMFRRKAPDARPTTAVGAESQQSEGLDNGSR